MHLRSATAQVLKFINQSGTVRRVAAAFGWLPGARYTNLRDVRDVERLGFLDIDWKDYNFTRHLAAARSLRPLLTVAHDVARAEELSRVLDQARELQLHCNQVAIVPKDLRLAEIMEEVIPTEFIFAYSVPTGYGATRIPATCFRRNVHLLGGRPDVQRALARVMRVVSFDCNRFTVDAAYGKFFDGGRFRRHPVGGYTRCLADSISNIDRLWHDYAD